MPGMFDFLHVKSHTKGSSNELSFDVLDAARDELDNKGKKNVTVPKAPSASQGSYHGVVGTSTLSAIPEVERRKKVRRRRVTRIYLGVAVLVIVAIGVVGFFAYSFQKNKADFSGRYDAIITEVKEVDEYLKEVDVFVSDPFNTSYKEDRKKALESVNKKNDQLKDIEEEASSIEPYATTSEDTVAVTLLQESVQAREDMLSAAKDILDLAADYDNQLERAAHAWSEVLQADQEVREATAAANKATTEESTVAARDKTQEARDGFADALSILEGIVTKHPGVDFSAQVEYLTKRIEALDYALATSDALLTGDREAAASNNDLYNAADQEATHMADDLPLLLDDLVLAAFEDELVTLKKDYEEARNVAVEKDSAIRSYLGS